uniref:Immunoglobulin domain-containing protein n=1 Tax=Takifugu rubripes TaxID=31033 RepID=A0A3B5KGZ4_TAKRU
TPWLHHAPPGDSVSIPCLYHPKYTSHVKYLCQGYYYEFCSYAVKTNWQIFTVTMSGLKMEDSGWYWCSRGDLQMPVQIIVREKPSTTAQPETLTSLELVSPSTTNEAEKPSTTDETEKPSTTDEDASNRSAALH